MSKASRNGRLQRSPTSSLSGIELFAFAVWHRSKAKITGAFAHRHSDSPTDSLNPCRFPPEIVGMIIAHLKYDVQTLKACAATCFSWYNIAIPLIHRTLRLRRWVSKKKLKNTRPNQLPSLFKLGLLPLVQQLQLRDTPPCWIAAAIFNPRNLQYFHAMVNLQELRIDGFDFTVLQTGFGESLGHFAPTLRSVALAHPKGNRPQMLDFFRLFPKLDDIEIWRHFPVLDSGEVLHTQLVPISGGLRGRLTLTEFDEEGLLECIAIAFGGMKFTFMYLRRIRGMRLLLDACSDTLETLCLHPDDLYPDQYYPTPSRAQDFNLSSLTVLRSIEVPVYSLVSAKEALSTITSPAFHEVVVVFSVYEVGTPSESLACVVRELYEIKEFGVAFCLVAREASRAEKQRMLALETERAVAAGLYDFLPCPPFIFSRRAAN